METRHRHSLADFRRGLLWITVHATTAQINNGSILPCERSYETLLYPICKWDGACAVPLPPSPCRRARGARRTHGLSSRLPTGPSSRPKPARMARSRAVLHQLTWLSGKWKVLFTFGCNRAFMFLMRQISPYAFFNLLDKSEWACFSS